MQTTLAKKMPNMRGILICVILFASVLGIAEKINLNMSITENNTNISVSPIRLHTNKQSTKNYRITPHMSRPNHARAYIKSITGNQPPKNGTWTINQTTIVDHENLTINGTINVESTGALILKNSELYMNLSSDGEYWIDVYGNLTVLDSLITAYNTTNNYFIRVFSGAKLRIENSEISYAGYSGGEYSGLWIATNDVILKNASLLNNYYGVYFYILTAPKIEVINCTFNNSIHNAIYIKDGTGGFSIINTTIANSGENGIWVYNNPHVNISNSKITGSGSNGIYLIGKSNFRIINNIITENHNGVHVYCPSKVSIINNTISNNSNINILFESVTTFSITNNIIENYVGMYLQGSSQGEIRNNTIIGGFHAIELIGGSTISIVKNTLKNNNYAIYCSLSPQDISIRENRIIQTTQIGIYFGSPNNLTIKNNEIQSAAIYGIEIEDSKNLRIINNTIKASTAIYLASDSNTTIELNTIKNSNIGIRLQDSDNTTITKNTLENISTNTIKITGESNNNTIYLNNFQTTATVSDTTNTSYDNGTYGNYWENYNGEDNNHDWIGDTPYIIGTNTQDNMPLMYLYQVYCDPTGDYDNDGLTNSQEKTHGTNPLNNDTDDDGMSDGWEVRYGLDPLDAGDAGLDNDGDGLSNLGEYQNGTDPLDSDTDDDGLGDYDEVIIYGTDPLDDDTDDDGLLDGGEVVYGTDPLDDDTDDDGLGDGDEVDAYGTDPLDDDTDDDGLPDGWEVQYGLDPLDADDAGLDNDGDGLSNLGEYQNGTDPLDYDTDGDGFSDGQEVKYGTDPLDPDDYPVVSSSETSSSTSEVAGGGGKAIVVGVLLLVLVVVSVLVLVLREKISAIFGGKSR